MHFKNLTLIAFLLLTLLGVQSMSNCNPTPPPEPGLTSIKLTVLQTDGTPAAQVMMGLLGASSPFDSRFFLDRWCLIDTFYTDFAGKRNISYVTNQYNNLWIAVLPDEKMASIKKLDSKNIILDFTTKPAEYLLKVHINKGNNDSVEVLINNIFSKNNQCEENNLDLSSIPLNLDYQTTDLVDATYLMKGIPYETNTIRVRNYKNDQIISDTIMLWELADTVVNIQIN